MSSVTIDLARRYLFGKKSTNSINIITGISIFGLSIGTAALILILSVFNGFEGLISGLFNAFNPDLKVTPIEGKFFDYNDELIKKITALPGVVAVSVTIEEIASFEYRNVQEVGMIKGVDAQFKDVTGLDTLIIDGSYGIQKGSIHFGLLGTGMRNKLAINVDDRLTPITVFMPSSKKKMLGAKEFNSKSFYPTGVFSVKTDSDYQYILSSYKLVSELMEKQGKASALEIKIGPKANISDIKSGLIDFMGAGYYIKDRYQQDETTLKVMKIEKWICFLITGLTILLIAFNLLGALWMITMDKRKDISVLKALGLEDQQVGKLFMQLGLLITSIGILMGFILALLIYYIQTHFGLVGVPDDFITDFYPLQLRASDFLIVSLTVLFLGALVSILPAKQAAQSHAVLRGK